MGLAQVQPAQPSHVQAYDSAVRDQAQSMVFWGCAYWPCGSVDYKLGAHCWEACRAPTGQATG